MTDLRNIAKKTASNLSFSAVHNVTVFQADKDIAFLLNAVVEERAKRLEVEFYQFDYRDSDKSDERYKWTDNDWHTQALRELDLEGVWPGKEK